MIKSTGIHRGRGQAIFDGNKFVSLSRKGILSEMELLIEIENWVIKNLIQFGLDERLADFGYIAFASLIIFSIAWLANLLVKRFVLEMVRSLAKKSKTLVGELLLQESFFLRVSHFAPAFVISTLSELVFKSFPVLADVVDVMVNLYLVVIVLWVIDSIIDTLYNLYEGAVYQPNCLLRVFVRQLKLSSMLPGSFLFCRFCWINPALLLFGIGSTYSCSAFSF